MRTPSPQFNQELEDLRIEVEDLNVKVTNLQNSVDIKEDEKFFLILTIGINYLTPTNFDNYKNT
jgi:hypothetical protein